MRLVAILIAAAVFATPARAQTGAPETTPLDPLYQCASIQTDAERLSCFDGAVASLRAAAAQGQVLAVDRAQVEEIRRDSFGFQLPVIARLFTFQEREPTRIEAQVVRIIQGGSGYATFVLSNGQSWRQTEHQRYNNVRVNDTIVVRNAAMGSFMLVPESGAGHRVHRVQ